MKYPPVAYVLAAVGCGGVTPGDEIRYEVAGIERPAVYSATDARGLDPATKVIGVSVAGQHRAYVVGAFEIPQRQRDDVAFGADESSLRRHVVNDLLGATPVTVTYCDLNECARVFTRSQRGPLSVAVGGWRQGKMTLIHEGGRFAQDAARPTLEELPHRLTSWGRWLKQHPDTDVYLGPAAG